MNLRSRVVVLALTSFLWASVALPSHQPPALWFDLEAGPYLPAFSVEYFVDDQRAWCEKTTPDCTLSGRPVRAFVWRPAASVEGPPMRLGDLLTIDPEDPSLRSYDDLLDGRAESTFGRQFFGEDREALARRLRSEPTWSFRQATSAPGPFPLVLHSLGRNDFQLESTVLWEYLASHGFVVAVVPQVGAGPEEDGLEFSAEDMRLQAEDMAFVARQMRTRDYVFDSTLGAIGHSSGAVAIFLMVEAGIDLGAIVSLDGSITTTDGRDLLEPLGWASVRVGAPILNIYRADKGSLDLWAVEQTSASDRYDVEVPAAIHFDFQNWPLYNALYEVDEARSAAVRSRKRARDVFLASVELTRCFLEGALGGKQAVLERLAIDPLPRALGALRLAPGSQTSQ